MANVTEHRVPLRSILAQAIRYLLIFFACVFVALGVWIRYRFGDVSLEQIISNLPVDGGEGVGNNTLVPEVVVFCLVLPALFTALVALAGAMWRRRGVHADRERGRFVRLVIRFFPVTAFVVTGAVVLTVVGVPQYAMATLDSRSLSTYYVTPALDTVPEVTSEASGAASASTSSTTSTSTKKNLITIYLESMENTFEDSSIFGENLLASLDEATSGWSRYDGLTQYTGGGWTMAGMVATQCGVPLKSRLLSGSIDLNSYGETVKTYLPGATCIGDILQEQGYTSVFLGGAAAGFAGKSTFYLTHGYSEDKGLQDWVDAGVDESEVSSQWGLSDHELFANAKKTVASLEDADSPFNLTLLTLDTHEPGQSYPSCPVSDDSTLAHSIKCSMRWVADFLTYLSDSGVLDDTVVVVMGDHLKPTGDGNQYSTELSRVADRTIVFRVWDPDGQVAFTRASADQLSVMPTVLSILGLPLVNGQGGVGVSFVGESSLSGTALALDQSDYESLLLAPSNDLYSRLWGTAD